MSSVEAPGLSAAKDASGTSAPGSSSTDGDTDKPGCPICEFIEAGPCRDQHKVWVACRGEAKEKDVDFVQHCGDTFRAFFGCMLSHQDYYKPFLEAFHVDTDLSQEAIDKANARKEHEQQQQQQQQQQQEAAKASQQQEQQQSSGHLPPSGAEQKAAAQQPLKSVSGGDSSSASPVSLPGHTPAAAVS